MWVVEQEWGGNDAPLESKKALFLRTGLLNFGVADGARTHDNRNHNPGLYQLSYSHR